jgi:hypothetical protein
MYRSEKSLLLPSHETARFVHLHYTTHFDPHQIGHTLAHGFLLSFSTRSKGCTFLTGYLLSCDGSPNRLYTEDVDLTPGRRTRKTYQIPQDAWKAEVEMADFDRFLGLFKEMKGVSLNSPAPPRPAFTRVR